MKTTFKTLPTVGLGAALLLSGLSLQAQTSTSDSSNTMNNTSGSTATDTTTNANTATANPSAASSTTPSAASGRTIYLGTKFKETPTQLIAHANGKVYDENHKLVGHLTDLDGKKLQAIPAAGDYKIETRMGKVIGSTQAGADVDSGRTVRLTPQ